MIHQAFPQKLYSGITHVAIYGQINYLTTFRTLYSMQKWGHAQGNLKVNLGALGTLNFSSSEKI